MRIFTEPAALLRAVGEPLGTSPALTVGDEHVSRFARAAGAGSDGLSGAGTVPPFLVLSLAAGFRSRIYEVRQTASAVNYGLNRVRFGEAVHIGDQLVANATLVAADQSDRGVVRACVALTISVRGVSACEAETVTIYHPVAGRVG
ncbi:hypothetical protein ABZ863_08685 [Saccharomonospora sp. NPDC046836]|uniref:hypothetical protein n=1 Tax=Saccharomonospora sp. NPDC046836 TaxID=3156921 RepID=UPI00340DF6E6